jgi:hypothetical protein
MYYIMSLKERLLEIQNKIDNYDTTFAIVAMKDIESEYDLHDCSVTDDFIANEDVDEFVRNRMNDGGWEGVACCLTDIVNRQCDDYYQIDGYANLTYVTKETVQGYLNDLKRELSDYLEEEEEE